MKRLKVIAEQCAGCRCCELACSFSHWGIFSPSFSRISVIKEDRYGMDYPVFCRQCDTCPCIDACPSGALTQNNKGIVYCDREACTGCGSCANACSYDAINLSPSSTPLICDLCGGEPACVEKCPTGTLIFEESDFNSEKPDEVFRELMRRWGIGG